MYQQQNVNCRKCEYFKVSWDPKMPYACAAFKIKSKQLPSFVVYESSGSFCKGFKEKEKKNP
jgi:hypothetical protein